MDFRTKSFSLPRIVLCLSLGILSLGFIFSADAVDAKKPQATLPSITIGPVPEIGNQLVLHGPDSRQQIIVSGLLSDGKRLI